MPPKKSKSTESLTGLFEDLNVGNQENQGSLSSLSSMSTITDASLGSRRNSPYGELDKLVEAKEEEEKSVASNQAIVSRKRVKPKKTRRVFAKKDRRSYKTKRGGRTPKEVYYKYSPNTGKRIRMTTKKKN